LISYYLVPDGQIRRNGAAFTAGPRFLSANRPQYSRLKLPHHTRFRAPALL
jgi:hypothetical protein